MVWWKEGGSFHHPGTSSCRKPAHGPGIAQVKLQKPFISSFGATTSKRYQRGKPDDLFLKPSLLMVGTEGLVAVLLAVQNTEDRLLTSGSKAKASRNPRVARSSRQK